MALCAALLLTSSLEAKKKKVKMPAAQNSAASKQHKALVKKTQRSHKAPKARKLKHTQRVN